MNQIIPYLQGRNQQVYLTADICQLNLDITPMQEQLRVKI